MNTDTVRYRPLSWRHEISCIYNGGSPMFKNMLSVLQYLNSQFVSKDEKGDASMIRQKM